MSSAKTTTDHDTIREWVEARDGHPASVAGTQRGREEAGILRIDFDPDTEGLDEISWEEFFEKFDGAKLAFLYQDETADGSVSRFHKFVDRAMAGAGDRRR